MVCCALIACKKYSVDFSYSPTAPRAGEAVQFSNLSSLGEEWAWSFGDGASSTIKSPTHTFKQPGTYRVVLKVDKKASCTKTKEITIYDTIPTYSCEDSVLCGYKDFMFRALVYNPGNYTVAYEWRVNDSVVGDASTLTMCFTQPEESLRLSLKVTMPDKETISEKTWRIYDRETNSVLLRTNGGDYRQRIFGDRAEAALLDASATELLDEEIDTAQLYNGHLFTLSDVRSVFPDILGFKIASRKIYYRLDGLWVANIDGSNPVQIDAEECSAMTLDTKDSRIYWANADGVWYMPFVGSDNNQFVTVPEQLNEMTDVTKIAADAVLR